MNLIPMPIHEGKVPHPRESLDDDHAATHLLSLQRLFGFSGSSLLNFNKSSEVLSSQSHFSATLN